MTQRTIVEHMSPARHRQSRMLEQPHVIPSSRMHEWLSIQVARYAKQLWSQTFENEINPKSVYSTRCTKERPVAILFQDRTTVDLRHRGILTLITMRRAVVTGPAHETATTSVSYAAGASTWSIHIMRVSILATRYAASI